MNKLFLLLFGLMSAWGAGYVQAQDTLHVPSPANAVADTVKPTATDSLLISLTDSMAAPALLPDHMLLTQRVVWGRRGLVRLAGAAPLTAAGRQKELKLRRTMLSLHQVGGFVTLAGFVAQGIVGLNLYNAQGSEYNRLHNLHESMATAINIAYGSTALLSLLSPPPAIGARRGLSSIKLHKYLAVLHLAGMVTTNILAHQVRRDYTLKPYHRAAAFTTFGAFTAALVVLKF